jgi:hypothetical protein
MDLTAWMLMLLLIGCRASDHTPGRAIYIGSGLAYSQLSDAQRDSVALADIVILGTVRPEHVEEMRRRNARQLLLQTIYWDVLRPLDAYRWRAPADTVWDLQYWASYVAETRHPDWWLRDQDGQAVPGWQGAPLPDWSPGRGYLYWLLEAIEELADRWGWGLGQGTVDGLHLESWYADPTWIWPSFPESLRLRWHLASAIFAAGLEGIARPAGVQPRLLLTAQLVSSDAVAGDEPLRRLWDGLKIENWPRRGSWWASWDDPRLGGLAWADRELAAPAARALGVSPAELCWIEVWLDPHATSEERARKLRWAAGTAALLGASLTYTPRGPGFHHQIPVWPDLRLPRARSPAQRLLDDFGQPYWARQFGDRWLIVNPSSNELMVRGLRVEGQDIAIARGILK